MSPVSIHTIDGQSIATPQTAVLKSIVCEAVPSPVAIVIQSPLTWNILGRYVAVISELFVFNEMTIGVVVEVFSTSTFPVVAALFMVIGHINAVGV